jgi:hypothetical protein
MARLCERPGCSQPAEVTYGISAEQLLVWIEPLDQAVAYRAGVLCRRHADSMVVPLGWMLDDRREAVPRLFKQRAAPPAVASPPRRRRSRSHRDDTGQLELAPAARDDVGPPAGAEALPAVVQLPETTHDDTIAPWKPVFDQSDDLDGLLQARSPLLSRAFGKRDQQPEP